MRACKKGVAATVDGYTDADSIAKLFATNYRDLYSCVSYNRSDLQSVIDDVGQQINVSSSEEHCSFSVDDVKRAIQQLEAHKNDPLLGLCSDYIINGTNDLLVHIMHILNAAMVHGILPENCLQSTIIPIPKGENANVTDSANYRGIALNSVPSKIFDNIILHRHGDRLSSSELQFGFKAKSLTTMCTMVLKETLTYYVRHQSSVYCSFLDATKAFDRVNYCKLFRLLLNRNVPACIIRVLLNCYVANYVCVTWN